MGFTEVEVFQPSHKPNPPLPQSQDDQLDLELQIDQVSNKKLLHDVQQKESLAQVSKPMTRLSQQRDDGPLVFQEKTQPLSCPFNLSTITEESGSYKSSSSGSRLTVSSASSK